MRFATLALFSGASVAAFSAWSNATSNQVSYHQSSSHAYSSSSVAHHYPTHTVTGLTTYCPSSTVFVITTCKHHVCAPTTISISEATSVTITDECLVEETETYHSPSPVIKTSEYIVTELVTYCPTPTTFTYTKYDKTRRIPIAYTVTEASSVTISDTCIVASTYTTTPSETSDHNVVYGIVTRTSESTVTDLITYCPTPTVLTVTKVVDNWKTQSAVTVTEAATLTVPGTCVIVNTFTEKVTLTASTAVKTLITPITETSVTAWTTICPYPTVLVVKTCKGHKCIPSAISVTEATTLTISGNLIVPCKETKVATVSVPETIHYTKAVKESTVTGLTTYFSHATVFVVKTCVGEKCVPSSVTVKEASTLKLSGNLVIPCTETYKAHVSVPVITSSFSTVVESTVTALTTYCPLPTVVVVKTCEGEKCQHSSITVHQATTLTISGHLVIPTTIATVVQVTASEIISYTSTVIESSVSALTTYFPLPTTFVVKTCSENKCFPSSVTVSEATTLVISGQLVVPCTVATVAKVTATVPQVKTYATTVIKSTVTGLTTYFSHPTVLSVETCIGDTFVPHAVTVTCPTTVVLPGTVVVPYTVTTPQAAPYTAPFTPGSTLTSVTVSGKTVPTGSTGLILASSTYAAVTNFQNDAAKKFVGFAGIFGFVVLLF